LNEKAALSLLDALDVAGEIAGFIAGVSLDEYLRDRPKRLVIERLMRSPVKLSIAP
jgi:hypothetical protein